MAAMFFAFMHCTTMLIQRKNIRKNTLKNGTFLCRAYIVDYQDDTTVIVDGMPWLSIVCKDVDRDTYYVLDTQQTGEEDYPIGATLDIYKWKDNMTYDPDSICKVSPEESLQFQENYIMQQVNKYYTKQNVVSVDCNK